MYISGTAGTSLLDRDARLIEAAADEIARLDTLADVAPPAVETALRLGCAAQAATPQAIDASLVSLTAQLVAAAAVEAPVPWLHAWWRIVDEEERRVRTGLLPTAQRVALQAAALGVPAMSRANDGNHALQSDRDAELDAHLDAAFRPGTSPRPALIRAVDAMRAVRFAGFADLLPALLLCATGNMNRLRLLPFAGATGEGLSALDECAAAARGRRLALRAALDAMRADEDALAPMGRAAIGARQALGLLRNSLATTVPSLSASLECSRPAAGDALERLAERGLAREITGRQRDRVFVDAHAWALVASA